DPLPDVAVHVVEPERIRSERSNRCRLPKIPPAAAAVAIGVASARIVPPGIPKRRTGPRGILPFGLCQKPIFLASQPREPAYILPGVAPAHIDYRHLPAPPLVCGLWARGCGDAGIPFFECHLELGNGEGLCDRHLVLRAFAVTPIRLVLRRPHHESARRN